MGIVLGIDVGGTFTDFIEIGGMDGARVVKVPSIPAEPAEGVMSGLTQLAGGTARLPAYMSGVELIVHGTTITTNAIITRRYAKTGYVTTKGFRDILNSRRGLKRNAFTAKEAPPEPIVPQYLVRTVDERLDKTGAVIQPLCEADVHEAAAHFRREGVEAVAVCTMFSFLNSAHEQRIEALLREELPGVYVTASHEVLPQLRFYERGSTTVFNACVGPLLRGYIDGLLRRLAEAGFRGRFFTMQSNGGVMPPEAVKVSAASTLLSGPASAPVAGLFFAKPYQIPNLITVDMGGTSFDVCLIRDGRAAMTSQSEVAEYALALPALDIHAIGAGGGSIAKLVAGMLEVGPESAGAAPGPACYGEGGTLPTVTDANLVLGYLNPNNFLGGEKKLHAAAAARAIEVNIAKPLNLTLAQAALGIMRVVDAKMADGVRAVSVGRGFDPRDACLVAAGGAGPLHACAIADELGMELILVPRASSVFCAMGMLATDLRQDVVRHASIRLSDGAQAVAALNEHRAELLRSGEQILASQQVAPDSRALEFYAEMLFEGQFNTIETRLPMLDAAPATEAELSNVRAAFEAAHRRIYGYVLEGEPIEIRSMRLAAIGRTVPPVFPPLDMATSPAEAALKGTRAAWFDGSMEVAVYDGARFSAGHVVDGPALVEHATTTIKIAPGWRACVDDIGNLLMWRRAQTLDEAIALLQERRG
jgi:N-methylhydantoinase A